MVIQRYKELWGDAGRQSDVLKVEGTNVVTPAISPVSNTTNAVFVFDEGSDGVTDLSAPIASVSAFPFLTGADLFIPALSPPDDTVEVKLKSRGEGPARTLNFPVFQSSAHRVSLHFQDFERK
jgi:hypothetical protein